MSMYDAHELSKMMRNVKKSTKVKPEKKAEAMAKLAASKSKSLHLCLSAMEAMQSIVKKEIGPAQKERDAAGWNRKMIHNSQQADAVIESAKSELGDIERQEKAESQAEGGAPPGSAVGPADQEAPRD